MFVRWSIGLQIQQPYTSNPSAFKAGFRLSDREYADLYTCLVNGGRNLSLGVEEGNSRIGDGRNAHEPYAPALGQDGLSKIGGTFKTAESRKSVSQGESLGVNSTLAYLHQRSQGT
jgi:hypothetical protein